MECGKLTAKLRDAVPVCFMVNGKEVKRYKNIEIPDSLKKLPFAGFKFDVPANGGAITFKIHFEPGILPDEWPEARERKSRKAKAEATAVAAIEAAEEAPDTERPEETEAVEPLALPAPDADAANEAEDAAQDSIEADAGEDVAEDSEEPAETGAGDMERAYNATGDRRKELVKAISEITGEPAKYQNAPSFAYQIGGYMVDKAGTLTGPHNPELLEALEARGFQAE